MPLRPALRRRIVLTHVRRVLTDQTLASSRHTRLLCRHKILCSDLNLETLTHGSFSRTLTVQPSVPRMFGCLNVCLARTNGFSTTCRTFSSMLRLSPACGCTRLGHKVTLCCNNHSGLTRSSLLTFCRSSPGSPFHDL